MSADCRLLILNEIKYSVENAELLKTFINESNNLNHNESQLFNKSIDVVKQEYNEFKWIVEINLSVEKNYHISLNSYDYSFNLIDKELKICTKSEVYVNMKRHYANIKNELGTYYLNKCSLLLKYNEENIGMKLTILIIVIF